MRRWGDTAGDMGAQGSVSGPRLRTIRRMSLPKTEDEILLLHNPRCSKSRATKAILDKAGATYATRLYLEEPLSADELAEVGRRLGKRPGEWVRANESAYAEAGLSVDASDASITEAVASHPVLMERPVVIRGARALIGRPPESAKHLLA